MPPASSAPGDRARLQGHLALLAVQVFFGLFPLFGKLAMRAFSPRALAGWRVWVGSAVLMGVAVAVHRRGVLPARGDLLRLQLCALLGIAVNQVLYLEGLKRAPSVNAALVMVLIPVFVFALAVLVRQERWVRLRGIGVLLAGLGGGLLLARRGADLGPEYLTGNLLMMANAFSYSIYLILAKPLAMRYPPLVLIAWVFTLSAWTVPLFTRGEAFVPAAVDTAAWLSLAYVLVFPTILAYLLNAVALARVSASTTAFYIFLQPFLAAAAGAVWLGETLDVAFGLAAALVLTGLWCVVRRPARVS